MTAELREMRPREGANDWIELVCPPSVEGLFKSAWVSGPLFAISSLVVADLPSGKGLGLQWHLSVSHKGKRPTDKELRRALRAFGMVGAEEDNHHPGVARHFWRPVDVEHRVDCECKATEAVVVEPDGYRWTNPTDSECRGCQWAAAVGRVCPLHGRGEG